MKCQNCGAELPSGARACPRCGAPVASARRSMRDLPDPSKTGAHPTFGGRAPQNPTPGVIEDDPISGDESSSKAGVNVAPWRMHTLRGNRVQPEVGPRKSTQIKHSEDIPLNAAAQPRKHTRGYYRAIVLFFLLLVALGVGIAVGGYALELWGGKSVPHVTGMTQQRAIQAMTDKGFSSDVVLEPSDSGAGYVLSTDPEGGDRAPAGSTVTLTVAADRTIPSVVGLSAEDAKAALVAAGAQNVSFSYTYSDQPEGTVIAVSPDEGSVFMGTEEVTLTVSQPPVVPDVVGKKESDAVASLQDAGLTADIQYERGTEDKKGLVLSTNPVANTRASESGVVKVVVADPNPSDYHHLLEYFTSPASGISTWLTDQGFTLEVGYRADAGGVVESLKNETGEVVLFSPTPWATSVAQPADTEPTDVLQQGNNYSGLALTIPAEEIAQTGDSQAVADQIVDQCGFGTPSETRTEKNVRLPEGVSAKGHSFVCEYGVQGDYCWTVLVRSQTGNKVDAIVTCAPKSLFNNIDLSKSGNSICDFIVYSQVYAGGSNSATSTPSDENKAATTANGDVSAGKPSKADEASGAKDAEGGDAGEADAAAEAPEEGAE